MTYLKAFIAGFASTLVFHQGLLWLLYTGDFRREHLGTWRRSRRSMYQQ